MQKSKNTVQRCVIYARFSCHNQSEQSIEGQLRDCQRYADEHNMCIMDTYIDRALTATSDRRPSFQRMIEDSEKRLFDVILVWKLDRFSRNRYDSSMYKHKLSKNGARVVSVMENISDSPEGVLMESVLEGFAEYFSRDLSQKILRGMRETALKHKVTGIIPFGYKKSPQGTYVANEITAPIVKKIFQMYIRGDRNIHIAEHINNLGFKTNTGSKFTQQTILQVIKRTRYTGHYYYGDLEISDETQRIISNEVFDLAQQRRISNKHHSAKEKAKVIYLLSTKLYCGICRKVIQSESGYGKNGIIYYYYKCSGKKLKNKCAKKTLKKDYIEEFVINSIINDVFSKSVIERIADAMQKLHSQGNNELSEVSILKGQLINIQKKIDNIINAIEIGIVTSSTQERLQELELTKGKLECELLNKQARSNAFSASSATKFLNSLSIKDFETQEQKKRLINNFVRRIYLWDDKILILYNFTPSTTSKTDDEIDFDKIINVMSEVSDITFNGVPKQANPNLFFLKDMFGFIFYLD